MKNLQFYSKFTLKTLFIFSTALIVFNGANAQIINTIAGVGGSPGYSGDGGLAVNAQLHFPYQITLDTARNIYIADYGNHVIRKITTSTGIITTIAGNGTGAYSGDGGQATDAELYEPADVALDSLGNIYIADYNNNRIRKITTSTGIITTIAGNGTGGYVGDGGQATAAELYQPSSIIFDHSGNLYIADSKNNVIRKITISTGVINTIAGNGIASYSGDGGQATAAELAYPTSVRIDSGNIFIADWSNSRVRKVTTSTRIITTVAGNGIASYSGDGGQATAAEINEPIDINFDASGNLYIADWMNERIRMVVASTGKITTIAGTGTAGYSGDGGAATAAELDNPDGVALDKYGNIYLADGTYCIIRKITMSSAGIEQLRSSTYVNVFPNPNSGQFTIQQSSIQSSGRLLVEVYNILGKQVYTGSLNSGNNTTTQIDISNNAAGVYLYKIFGIDGKIVGEGKLIVE